MIILIDAEKHLTKIQHYFMIKNIQQTRKRQELPQLHKQHL